MLQPSALSIHSGWTRAGVYKRISFFSPKLNPRLLEDLITLGSYNPESCKKPSTYKQSKFWNHPNHPSVRSGSPILPVFLSYLLYSFLRLEAWDARLHKYARTQYLL